MQLRGMTQAELAEKVFAKDSTISDYENNKHDINAGTLMLLAEVLQVKVGYFFGEVPIAEYEQESCSRLSAYARARKMEIEKDVDEMDAIIRGIARPEVRRVCIETVKGISRLG